MRLDPREVYCSFSSRFATLPFGVYDLQANPGSLFAGVSHETSAFAVTSISRWGRQEGCRRYPNAKHLLILADTGGSDSATRGLGRINSSSISVTAWDSPVTVAILGFGG